MFLLAASCMFCGAQQTAGTTKVSMGEVQLSRRE